MTSKDVSLDCFDKAHKIIERVPIEVGQYEPRESCRTPVMSPGIPLLLNTVVFLVRMIEISLGTSHTLGS